MKLSQETISILKSFSTINSNLNVKEGNVLETINLSKSLIAYYTATEQFPNFAIENLSEFINIISLFKSPDIIFNNNHILIKDLDSNREIKYGYGDPNVFQVKCPSTLKMPESEISFDLKSEDMSTVLKAASILKVESMIVRNNPENNSTIILESKDTKLRSVDTGSNSFSSEIPANYNPNLKFNVIFNINNLTIINGDYTIDISSKLISKFTNKNIGLVYYISADRQSKFS